MDFRGLIGGGVTRPGPWLPSDTSERDRDNEPVGRLDDGLIVFLRGTGTGVRGFTGWATDSSSVDDVIVDVPVNVVSENENVSTFSTDVEK